MSTDTLVYGERVADLLPALLKFELDTEADEDGMCTGSWRLDPCEAAPFLRALMRAEADLLRQDADAVGTPDQNDRTQEQRAADALVGVIRAACDASSASPLC
jgi:hypothetical protein